MKSFVILSLLFFAISANAENIQVLKFASEIKQLISEKNTNSLKELNCYPHANHCVSDRTLEFIFKNNNGELHSLISSKKLKIKVYGPYTYDEKHPDSSYVILFYIPQIIKFRENGLLSEKTQKEHWNKNLTETVVTVISGKVHLNRTIFYFEAHAPWADDYG